MAWIEEPDHGESTSVASERSDEEKVIAAHIKPESESEDGYAEFGIKSNTEKTIRTWKKARQQKKKSRRPEPCYNETRSQIRTTRARVNRKDRETKPKAKLEPPRRETDETNGAEARRRGGETQ